MDIERLQLIVARTTVHPGDEEPQGTAFLLTENMALTCAHCVLDENDKPVSQVKLQFTAWNPPTAVTAEEKELWKNERVVPIDPQLVDPNKDVAILRFHPPVPSEIRKHIPDFAENGVHKDEWNTFAYPKLGETDGIEMGGRLDNPSAKFYGEPAMQLSCTKSKDKVEGASGGPIALERTICGILIKQFLINEGERSAFDVVYGLPLLEIADWFDKLGMPQLQKTAPRIGPGASRDKRPLRFMSILCNRNLQVLEFTDNLQTRLLGKTGRALTYLIYGVDKEAHLSLVNRFIKQECRKIVGRSPTPAVQIIPEPLVVKWPHRQDIASGMLFLNKMICKELSERPILGRIVVIKHILDAQQWDKNTGGLVREYSEYWSKKPPVPPGTQALIFFSISYPVKWSKRREQDIETELAGLSQVHASCIKIPKLDSPERLDVINWFETYDSNSVYSQSERDRAVKAIFGSQDRKYMQEVEDGLRKYCSGD